MQLDEFIARLSTAREYYGIWKAPCPAHEDSSPSLVIKRGPEGNILVHCFAGCSVFAITKAMGLAIQDLFADKTIKPRLQLIPKIEDREMAFQRWRKSHEKVKKITESIRQHPHLFEQQVDIAMDLVLNQSIQAAIFALQTKPKEKEEQPPYCWWACSLGCFPSLMHEEGCGGCKAHATCSNRLCEDHCHRVCWTYSSIRHVGGRTRARKRLSLHTGKPLISPLQ